MSPCKEAQNEFPSYKKLCRLINQLHGRLESKEFLHRHRKNKQYFAVIAVLSFVTIVLRSLQDKLDVFYKAQSQRKVAPRVATKSVFSQARKKLKASVFVKLNAKQLVYSHEHFAG